MTTELGIDLSANDASAEFTPGTTVTMATSAGVKTYKYIQYKAGTGSIAAAVGNVAVYVKPATDTTGTVCTCDASDGDGVGAGVLQAALTTDYYGWVQIKGVATLTTALTAGADGNALTAVGAGDKTLDVSAAVTDAVCAYAIDASAKIVLCDFPY